MIMKNSVFWNVTLFNFNNNQVLWDVASNSYVRGFPTFRKIALLPDSGNNKLYSHRMLPQTKIESSGM
jgi:hypothetical protein